ncbi:hypothetical protein D9M68_305190 [compost metagenome]|uniref:Uncharacterized protein n=1 Tax=Pseudomonas jinjuensis TaxID=198616 RepID=A0A1H0H9T5_9PSED|nr:hypothetical protein SAMN05216193_108136 [Pseudomonas jinjuensis]
MRAGRGHGPLLQGASYYRSHAPAWECRSRRSRVDGTRSVSGWVPTQERGNHELHLYPHKKKEAHAGLGEWNRIRSYTTSIFRGAMKYIQTSAMKYIAGIMVNSTA